MDEDFVKGDELGTELDAGLFRMGVDTAVEENMEKLDQRCVDQFSVNSKKGSKSRWRDGGGRWWEE